MLLNDQGTVKTKRLARFLGAQKTLPGGKHFIAEKKTNKFSVCVVRQELNLECIGWFRKVLQSFHKLCSAFSCNYKGISCCLQYILLFHWLLIVVLGPRWSKRCSSLLVMPRPQKSHSTSRLCYYVAKIELDLIIRTLVCHCSMTVSTSNITFDLPVTEPAQYIYMYIYIYCIYIHTCNIYIYLLTVVC